MGLLSLVRHGQASAHEANYDRLSALGERQARLLGMLWKERGTTFDRVFCGPRARQQRTAQLAAEEAGLPAPVTLDSLDEMRIEPLFQKHLPTLFQKHPHLQTLGDAMLAADGDLERAKAFARLFEAALQLWLRGELGADGIEQWHEFQARVQRMLEEVQSEARGKRIALFTSAGVISMVLQKATGMSDDRAIDCAFRVRNSSVSEFLFSNGRFSLASFNETPHLTEAALVTVL
jgi:broad specificity phosphatase PhoE